MENYNPPSLKLAFDARGATSQTINAPYEGTKTTLTIYSYRDTKVNGKVTGSDLIDFTTKITSDGNISDTWIFTKKAVNDALSYSLEIEIRPNLGGARTGTITLTQASSGKTITINISQAAGVIVQEYVFTGPAFSSIRFLADGGTQTVEVESYILYSDGSKVAEVPYVDSKPTWLTVEIIPKSQIIGNTKYSVKVTAAPNTGTTGRRENLVLRQGAVEGKELTFVVSQGIPVTDIEIELTITNLPTDGTGALFGEFEVPNSNSALGYFAFSILGTSHKFTYKKSTGLAINLSTPGETDTAYIGDIIRLYTWDSNSTRWVYRTQFALPSSDTTIPAY